MKVLIVDDHELYVDGIHRLLQQMSVFDVVHKAHCCAEARQHFQQHIYDLIILDFILDTCTGLELVDEKNNYQRMTPLVFLSCEQQTQHIEVAINLGAYGWLNKRDSSTIIEKKLRLILEGDKQFPLLNHVPTRKPHWTSVDQRTLQALAQGLNNKQIAKQHYVTYGTVRNRVSRIYQKLNVSNRVRAIRVGKAQGLL